MDIKTTHPNTNSTTIREPATPTTQAVNPILKKDQHQHNHHVGLKSSPLSLSNDADGTSVDQRQKNSRADGKSTPDRDKKHLTWDEDAIEEHDLLRGTRMKVGCRLRSLCSAVRAGDDDSSYFRKQKYRHTYLSSEKPSLEYKVRGRKREQ